MLTKQVRIKMECIPDEMRLLRDDLKISQAELAEILDSRCSDREIQHIKKYIKRLSKAEEMRNSYIELINSIAPYFKPVILLLEKLQNLIIKPK